MAVIKIKQPPIREITLRSFLGRLGKNFRISLRNAAKTDDEILDSLELLHSSPSVRLDSETLLDSLNYLKSEGHIDEDMVLKLTADGLKEERFK